MSVEHILLSSGEEQGSRARSSGAPKAHACLHQRSRLRRCHARFVLFDERYIAIDSSGLGQNAASYEVDLGFLDPRARRARSVSWSGMTSSMLFAGLGCAWGIFGFLPGAVAAAAGAVVCIVLTAYRSHDRLVFYSRHGRVPLVVLFNRNPDRQRFAQFVDELVRHIKAAHADWPEVAPLLSGELREHRRLLEEGVLSEKRYAIAKARILGQHQ